jgi:hypothetical protein
VVSGADRCWVVDVGWVLGLLVGVRVVGGLLLFSLVVCCVGEVMAYGWLVRQGDRGEDVGDVDVVAS